MSGALLAQWLVDRGGFISDAVSVVETGVHGRSLRASREVVPGELVLRVPVSIMIAPELGMQVLRSAGMAKPETRRVADEVLLAAYVAEHLHREGGFHRPYFDALPTLNDLEQQLPLFWSVPNRDAVSKWPVVRESMREMEPKAAAVLQNEIKVVQEDVESERAGLHWDGGQPFYARQHFKHAWAVVMSRNFLLKHPRWIDGGRCFLIPFGDLLNHGGSGPGGANLEWTYNAAEDSADFLSNRRILQGKEFLINYSGSQSGRHPLQQDQPFHFLLCYGFLEKISESDAEEDAGPGQPFQGKTRQILSPSSTSSMASSSMRRLRVLCCHVSSANEVACRDPASTSSHQC